MSLNKQIVAYNAFGLNIESDIFLPELKRNDEAAPNMDVEIKWGDLKTTWCRLNGEPKKFIVQNNCVMFQVQDTAIFSIQDGKRIVVSPLYGSKEDKIRLYILGTCMGVIMMQKRILPLHGSAVAINGKAYAFVGDKGAGKSTLATAFINKGYPFISDDLTPVTLTSEKKPIITPSYPQQKLWRESLEGFGMRQSDFKPLFERENKFAVPVSCNFITKPLPLAGVFELVRTENENIQIMPIPKLERLFTLFNHTFRSFLVPRLGLLDWHFNCLASFINQIDMYQLQRPSSRFTADSLFSMVMNTIKKEEKVH